MTKRAPRTRCRTRSCSPCGSRTAAVPGWQGRCGGGSGPSGGPSSAGWSGSAPWRAPRQRHDASSEALDSLFGAPATTDLDGRFCLPDISRKIGTLTVRGGEVAGREFEVGADSGGGELRLELGHRCTLQVDLAERLRDCDGAFVVDGAGTPLPPVGGPAGRERFVCPVVGGRTGLWTVDERARELCLLAGDRELARVPIRLVPGEVHRVRID